jgi:hypothetical protein
MNESGETFETMHEVLVLGHREISEEDKHDLERRDPQSRAVVGSKLFLEENHEQRHF